MADLSGLKLRKLNKTNWDEYPVGGSFTPPHYPGIYTGRLKSLEFQSKDGFLTAVADTIIEDALEGRNVELRDWLFTKPIQQGRRKGSCRAGDFLLACGSERRPGEDPQEWADALEECVDGLFQFQLDWSCYDTESSTEHARNYEDFPVDPENPDVRQPFILIKDADGNDKRLTARQRVRYYITNKV